ncbi:hypothetical protein [uncultured Vibrio sp.]|uniref:hypothetical protein n=1 Tax=uncultured Vibrio sp. TaxID=114054 RepID=UPI0025D12CC1|nr:hypothetical protein [uncultured Vibrio sp.]
MISEALLVNLEQQRQSQQLAFVASGENILIGSLDDFPLSLEQLKSTSKDSPYVVKAFDSGLTAVVYHIHLQGKDWTLKCQRPESLVKNVDGETSFLNEVQRRRDVMDFKFVKPTAFKAVVDTHFASYRDGIMLSPWISGGPIESLNQDLFEQIFDAIVNLELSGLFEWDFCPGNILLNEENQIRLFDFGYMYQFEPLKHFNSNGTDTPLFHGIERFETRFFFDYLLKNPKQLSDAQQLELYRVEKSCALNAYLHKLSKLTERGASDEVLEWHKDITSKWQAALESESALKALYLTEAFRSNILDLLDDVHGKSCSPYTLRKADFIIERLEMDFDLLASSHSFFFGDERLSQGELIQKYRELKQTAERYQLS